MLPGDPTVSRPVPLQAVPTSADELVAQYGGLVGQVVAFVVTFVVVWLLGRFLVVPVVGRLLASRGFDETVWGLVEDVARVVVVALAVATAFTVAGFGAFLVAFATLGGALALALGFAAQDLVANFVAGVFILKDRPFRAGDWIEWGEYAGTVEEIALRVTTVRTFDNEKVTVPNAELANNAVTNPVAYDRLRQEFVFGVGYDVDLAAAIEVIHVVLASHDAVLAEPAPDVAVTELGESAVGLTARYWLAGPGSADLVGVRSELVQAVKRRFDEAGIDIPYPYRQLTGSIEVRDVEALSPESAATDD